MSNDGKVIDDESALALGIFKCPVEEILLAACNVCFAIGNTVNSTSVLLYAVNKKSSGTCFKVEFEGEGLHSSGDRYTGNIGTIESKIMTIAIV